ncbi:LuxS/MPP-like metallohydrolase [Amniculicola lignicola CBS 123094]|uniref:LuxS/MPP-like metallohydrolase n=1 Tax=Amniculicola lignicola CBS 123094 TaxID=1392246 RepID=A0A6A5W8F6_9PLEO|nr:LuxS/MPP-like metallohydrolase [Amniculicola lignicola CBS 123094]
MNGVLGREARTRIEDLERPALDDRSYRIITLPNNLEVLLIHDPKTDKASAALDVNVGSFSDVKDMPGIAHAVEHLLFMGTEKYPQENAYNQYLSSHSGHSNAYTASTSTNYYFELAVSAASPTSSGTATPSGDPEPVPASKEESPLWGALDRFGQFFICPLFLEDTLDRELKAVDSENKKNLQSDTWRLHQLNKALSNPNHPYCHFSTGSYKTLHDDPIARGVKIRDEFIKFHSTHYSANRMKLVVLGREKLDTLEEWVDEIFSEVPNKDLPRKRWDDVSVYTEKELLTQTFAKPVFQSRSLDLSFLYRDEEDFYESHPSRYLSHLIGHEGPGSILSYIKAKGWATGLGAGGSSLCPGSGLFNISVKLTEVGLEHYKEVAKIVFQYIAMIREQPPQKWIVDEQIQISEVDFRFRQKSPPSKTTSALAGVMQKPYDRKMLLSGPSVTRKFDDKAISDAMEHLRPDNFRLTIVSQEYPGGWDQKEKWYGTEYKSGKIPEDFLAEIKEAFENPARPVELQFPHKNEFIPSRLEVEKKEVEQPLKAPKLIRNDEGVRTWFKKDDQFWVPKANVHIYFRTPMPCVTARTTVMSQLYRELIYDALVEYSYDADISGLVYEFSTVSTGLTISVEGYNDKLHVLLEKVLVSIRDLEIREDRFKIIADRITRGFHNWDYQQPFHQVGSFSRYLKNERGFLTDELAKELEGVTAQDVQQFYPLTLAQGHIEILAHGNLHKEEALKITDLVEKTLKPKRLPLNQWPVRRNLIVPPGSNYIYERQLKDPANVNHCIEYSLYLGNTQDRAIKSRLLLVAQMTDEPAFNQLRTLEQLGYVVFSGGSVSDQWAGYRILIQSEKDCKYLEGRIEHFLTSFEKMLEDMKEDEFEGHKRAVVNKRLEKLKNLNQEGNRFWTHISNDGYDFFQAEEDVVHISALTKQDMQTFYMHYISPSSPHRAKFSVHLTAQAKPKQATPEEQKSDALAIFQQILTGEKIETDQAKLAERIKSLPSDKDHTSEMIVEAITAYLTQDLQLATSVVDKILDEAKAALGLADTPETLIKSVEELKIEDLVKEGKVPVYIKDLKDWKAGLMVSKGMRPVTDLGEFGEGAAKL